jgi:two-component system OmpR family sensor kinase
MRTLTYSLILFVLIATTGLGWLFDRLYEQYREAELNQGVDAVDVMQTLTVNLALTLNELPNRQAFVQQWEANQKSDTLYQLELISADSFPLPQALLNDLKQGKPLLLESNNQLTFHQYLATHNEVLILKSPLVDHKPATSSLKYVFTFVFYLALLLLFLVWAYPLVRQLIALRNTAKLFGEGQLNQRMSLGRVSYIRDIENEFNAMAQRIENQIEDIKLLSSAVSHDLRTPLARIRFGLDTLHEEDDPTLRRKYEKKIGRNVDEMTGLVETLLNYARLDQSMLAIRKDKVDLSQIIAQSVNSNIDETKNVSFDKTTGDYIVLGDPVYLGMLVNNLLQNALQYCREKVMIELSTHKNKIVMTIADDGQGIDVDQRENILKPFVRGAFHQKTLQQGQTVIKGHGIGLAMVKRILDWHQGEIHIGQCPQLSGAQFTITLPSAM